MPFALAIIGAALILSAIRGTQNELGTLIKGDFTGSGSFLVWLVAILAIGTLGYAPALRTPSRLLLGLIILALLIANKGFFAQAQQALSQAGTQPATQPSQTDQPPLPAAFPVAVTQTGGGTSTTQQGGADAAGIFQKVAGGLGALFSFA